MTFELRQLARRVVPLVALVAVVSASQLLTACAPLIVGSMAMTALVATDRRTSGTQLEDEGIELRAGSRIREALADRAHVNISSYNRQVLLTGEVPTSQDKQTIAQIVSRVENVRAVVNEVGVMANSTLSQRSSDSLITGKLKAALVDAKDLFANSFKVVTDRGTVHLMGRVTQREADRATEIARSVSGVQRVVRIFEIITEQELQNLLPQPAPGDAKKQ